MDKFVKSLKTTKRRLSQQLKVATGKSEITTDATYDLAYHQFSEVEANLKMLGTQCVSLIQNVDSWCDTNRKLADELLRFTSKSDVGTTDMNTYKVAVNNLHKVLQGEYDYTRRAIICVLRAHILKRIEQLIDGEFAEVEKVVKTRKNIVTDYDSHRNKCSMYERKGDSVNADKFRMKMDHDHQMLQEHTAYLEKRFEELNKEMKNGKKVDYISMSEVAVCDIGDLSNTNGNMQKVAIESNIIEKDFKSLAQTFKSIIHKGSRIFMSASNEPINPKQKVNAFLAIDGVEGVGGLARNGKIATDSASRNAIFTQHYEQRTFQGTIVEENGEILGINITGKQGAELPYNKKYQHLLRPIGGTSYSTPIRVGKISLNDMMKGIL